VAAYEVLLLNTAIPQIQAAQSGDTYVVPRDIAFSTVANLANGTNLLPSLTFSSDTNTGIYREGADALGFTAGGGTNQMVLTSTGLGIGTNNPAYKLDVAGSGASTLFRINNATTGKAAMAFANNGTVAGAVALSGWWEGDSSNDLSLIAETGYGLRFYTNGSPTEKAVIDTSGNLGLGVTPSALWVAGASAFQQSVGSVHSNTSLGSYDVAYNSIRTASDSYIYGQNGLAATRLQQRDGSFRFFNAPSGTANTTTITNNVSYTIITSGNQTDFGAANNNVGTVFTANASGTLSSGTVSQNISFTQAMTLDASGDLLVGNTTQYGTANRAAVFSANKFGLSIIDTTAQATGVGGALNLGGNYRTNGDAQAFVRVAAAKENSTDNNYAYAMTFSTTPNGGTFTEAARITSGGYFKASNSGSYVNNTGTFHELRSDTADAYTVRITQSNATPLAACPALLSFTGSAPNDTTAWFLDCTDNTARRAYIRSNGGFSNYQANDTNLSDRREKTNFAPAKSYLETICAIPVQTFNYIDQSEDDPGLTLGVVAQDVQAVAPELVMESNWGTEDEPKMRLSIYQTDLQYALMKCIQELKSELDSVKAELAALKGA
jgi:hypothetical protein